MTLVSPPAKGLVDARTGKPVGSDDSYFLGMNDDLADKGFLTTSVDELITWARTGSLMWMTFGLACRRRCRAMTWSGSVLPRGPAHASPT
jgi:NADH-quinone oxidoreductase subunit B